MKISFWTCIGPDPRLGWRRRRPILCMRERPGIQGTTLPDLLYYIPFSSRVPHRTLSVLRHNYQTVNKKRYVSGLRVSFLQVFPDKWRCSPTTGPLHEVSPDRIVYPFFPGREWTEDQRRSLCGEGVENPKGYGLVTSTESSNQRKLSEGIRGSQLSKTTRGVPGVGRW